jgi:glutamine amidotransferase
MCELFAVSSSFPTCVNVCLHEFQQHGGSYNKITDGWGMAFYEGNDARIIRETDAAYQSQHMDFIRTHDYSSSYMLSHIRQATVGETRLQNTQPFSRELGGRLHVFAHNGDLENMKGHLEPDAEFLPIGNSDSEFAFCDLMGCLKNVGGPGAGRWSTGSAWKSSVTTPVA